MGNDNTPSIAKVCGCDTNDRCNEACSNHNTDCKGKPEICKPKSEMVGGTKINKFCKFWN